MNTITSTSSVAYSSSVTISTIRTLAPLIPPTPPLSTVKILFADPACTQLHSHTATLPPVFGPYPVCISNPVCTPDLTGFYAQTLCLAYTVPATLESWTQGLWATWKQTQHQTGRWVQVETFTDAGACGLATGFVGFDYTPVPTCQTTAGTRSWTVLDGGVFGDVLDVWGAAGCVGGLGFPWQLFAGSGGCQTLWDGTAVVVSFVNPADSVAAVWPPVNEVPAVAGTAVSGNGTTAAPGSGVTPTTAESGPWNGTGQQSGSAETVNGASESSSSANGANGTYAPANGTYSGSGQSGQWSGASNGNATWNNTTWTQPTEPSPTYTAQSFPVRR
ncbi:hypothetical protein BC830DRAFT_1086422 [Chytriomyces sp. MP71]|nr:hypothetical protein BC830DRAFT_1086422 [Chytriomyces sp. MP71]